MNHTSAKKLGENTGTTVGIRTTRAAPRSRRVEASNTTDPRLPAIASNADVRAPRPTA